MVSARFGHRGAGGFAIGTATIGRLNTRAKTRAYVVIEIGET